MTITVSSTPREQLESAVADLVTQLRTIEANPSPSAADLAALNRRSALVDSLRSSYKGHELVKSLAGPTGSTLSPEQQFLAQQGHRTDAGARGFAGSSPLNFSEATIAELHKGVLSRHTVTKDALTSTDVPMALVGSYQTTAFPFLRERTRILDLIPSTRTDAPTVHYFRGTVAASAADSVAAGANKPYSEPHWEAVEARVEKLAHYTRANDEVLADASSFQTLVGTEMIAGLIDCENDQLLNGSGVTPDLLGLLIDPNIQTIGSAGTDLDAVAAAANAVRTVAFVEPDVVVMHPNDWASTGFLLAKDTSGQYLVGNPLTNTTPSLWGMRVVLTTRIAENTLMVANLKEAAKVYVRQPPTLEVQPGGGTAEFIANQTLIRAEERLALTIVRPKAICLVTAV
jgi:HK97 family phage major capsid protein